MPSKKKDRGSARKRRKCKSSSSSSSSSTSSSPSGAKKPRSSPSPQAKRRREGGGSPSPDPEAKKPDAKKNRSPSRSASAGTRREVGGSSIGKEIKCAKPTKTGGKERRLPSCIPAGVFEVVSPEQSSKVVKNTSKDSSSKKSETAGVANVVANTGGKAVATSEAPASAPVVSEKKTGAAPAPPKKGLGDLAELQKKLEEDIHRLQLFVIKAKAEHEEKKETDERRERREREYYKASHGEPCGPGNRFLVESEIGKGAFSTVYRCRDVAAREHSAQEFAVKFVRMNAMLRKATEREVKMYRRLRNNASVEDPDGARCLMNLGSCETFEHHGHLAVVFPLQRCDLRAGLKKYGQGKGLPLALVSGYAKNIFCALRALRKVNLIHSDLKPENLLMSLDKMSVKLADFGSAMDVNDRVRSDEAQPRFYRAPEVMLGHQYSMQIDIWSAGATLFEFATGRFLFTGETNNGMLHSVLKVCGAFDKAFATHGEFASKHFNSNGDFRLMDKTLPAGEAVVSMTSFPKPTKPLLELVESNVTVPSGFDAVGRQHKTLLQNFADLVARCTAPDPEKRVSPEPALAHSFFRRRPG